MDPDIFIKVGKIELAYQWLDKSQIVDFAHEVHVLKLEEKIQYRILEADPIELTIRVTQGKPNEEAPKTAKQLSNQAKRLFEKYFPNQIIHTRSIPYREVPAKEMTSQTLKRRLSEQGISLDKIVAETGIPRRQIYDWVSGAEPMDAVTRAMFYYMLR
jgi:predicted Rossmann fold nucleotide-binding protein DprA/Smf involved in DNA uptake